MRAPGMATMFGFEADRRNPAVGPETPPFHQRPLTFSAIPAGLGRRPGGEVAPWKRLT